MKRLLHPVTLGIAVAGRDGAPCNGGNGAPKHGILCLSRAPSCKAGSDLAHLWAKCTVRRQMPPCRGSRGPGRAESGRGHPFATLKAWMGATHFLARTLEKVRTEMSCRCWPTTSSE